DAVRDECAYVVYNHDLQLQERMVAVGGEPPAADLAGIELDDPVARPGGHHRAVGIAERQLRLHVVGRAVDVDLDAHARLVTVAEPHVRADVAEPRRRPRLQPRRAPDAGARQPRAPTPSPAAR